MGEHSSIEWTHHTFNPWWGCTKVSEACRNCYAEAIATRFAPGNWGPSGRRRFFGDAHWEKPRAWNRRAAKAGERHRVFCASMADVFEALPDGHPDEAAMDAARRRLWHLIRETPHLDWLLLTKRPENICRHGPWFELAWRNIWLGVTVEDQAAAAERIPHLLRAAAWVHFVSCEPLLGPLDLRRALRMQLDAVDGRLLNSADDDCRFIGGTWRYGLDWVIAGGESGLSARPSRPAWFGSLRDQCAGANVPFLFKQWGEWAQEGKRVGKRRAGRELDGRTWDELPRPAFDADADRANQDALRRLESL